MFQSSVLEELVSPLSLVDFQEQYFSRFPFSAPLKASRFSRLLNWDFLQEIFQVNHDNCWLPRRGRLSEEFANDGYLCLREAQEGFARGHTILIRHSEEAHPAMRELADDFHRVFGWPVDIQIYGTPEGEMGFDWHYDVEDVFVIQSSGEKEFYLRQPVLNPPPRPVVIPKHLSDLQLLWRGPEIRCHLKAGDWLYIPAGYWHRARAITPSFHFSVGVLKPLEAYSAD